MRILSLPSIKFIGSVNISDFLPTSKLTDCDGWISSKIDSYARDFGDINEFDTSSDDDAVLKIMHLRYCIY